MECPEPFPSLTDHLAWEAGKRQLEQVGFSSEQIAGLLSQSALSARGLSRGRAFRQATSVYPLALPPGSPAKLSGDYDACASALIHTNNDTACLRCASVGVKGEGGIENYVHSSLQR